MQQVATYQWKSNPRFSNAMIRLMFRFFNYYIGYAYDVHHCTCIHFNQQCNSKGEKTMLLLSITTVHVSMWYGLANAYIGPTE